MPSLLAVDLGLKTGLALYGDAGRLRWYRSHHFGSPAQLKRGVYGLLNEVPDLAWLVVEGGGDLAVIWERAARRRQVGLWLVDARVWRDLLLYDREQRGTDRAKQAADTLARRVIDWAGAPRPTTLRHDAAEAILIGLWGVLQVGWLHDVPETIRR